MGWPLYSVRLLNIYYLSSKLLPDHHNGHCTIVESTTFYRFFQDDPVVSHDIT